jgi:hypothetical protein
LRNEHVNCARWFLKPTHNTSRNLWLISPEVHSWMHVHKVTGRSSMKMNVLRLNAIFLRREEWKSVESSCHTVHCHIDFQTFLTKTSWQLRHHFRWALGDAYKFSFNMVVNLYREITESCKFWILGVFCYSESRTRTERRCKYRSKPL